MGRQEKEAVNQGLTVQKIGTHAVRIGCKNHKMEILPQNFVKLWAENGIFKIH